MGSLITDEAKRETLARIGQELGRLHGQANEVNERFIAFVLASAKREAEARAAEIGRPSD